MASADKTYVDPSALRRLYVHDDHSRAFCAWRARLGGSLPLTLHGRAELVNSIALAVFRRDISAEKVLKQAADLSQEHTPKLGTRTLDVLHVAAALVLGCRNFVTYDDRQAALARAVKLRLIHP